MRPWEIDRQLFWFMIVVLAICSVPVYGVIVMFRRVKICFEPHVQRHRQYEMLYQVEEDDEDLISDDIELDALSEDLRI